MIWVFVVVWFAENRFGWGFLERFVARVLQDGKVTIPKRLRELLGVVEGDYVHLDLVEVIEVKQKSGG